jgi:uncharacterized OsmC-like protein
MDGTTVEVEKHMATAPQRRIAKLVARVRLPAGLSPEQRQKMINAAAACPVAHSLHPDIVQDVTFS